MLVSAVLLIETVSIQHVLCVTVNLLAMPCLAVKRLRKEQRHCLNPSSGRAQFPPEEHWKQTCFLETMKF